MDSFSGPLAPHPVVRCVAGIGAALDEVDGTGPMGMTLAEKQEKLLELSRQIERAQGLKLAVMATSEDVAAESADRDIAAWLAPRVQPDQVPAEGRRGDRGPLAPGRHRAPDRHLQPRAGQGDRGGAR